jgi:DNA repair protein REV1
VLAGLKGDPLAVLQELKQLMTLHGGQFILYPSRATPATHVICSNLPDAKVKLLQKERNPTPYVRPEWVVDCLAAGRLLPVSGQR